MKHRIQVDGFAGEIGVPNISFRCPACHQIGVLERFGSDHRFLVPGDSVVIGERRCPKEDCHQLIVIWSKLDGALLNSYPPERLDIDTSDIPHEVVECLEEAMTCHADGCHRAAAMMVRRAIEVACDLNEAEGSNLYERVEALGAKAVLPKDLLDGMHNLRLLGNDAAHVTAKDYDNIGDEEIRVALEVVSEILEALYQHRSLVARLAGLKSSPAA